MKILGIIVIVIGLLMFVFGNITFTNKKKVAEVGPVEINRKEKKTIAWPNYAGGVTVVAGLVILIASGRRRN